MRAGAYALSLLSVPLNVYVLKTLEEEPRPLIELRRAVGSPPQTTMRGNLRALTELGVLERRRQSGFPGSVDYELGGTGRQLLKVAKVLQDWLADSPEGPLPLGSPAAKSAIKALIDGWSSSMVRALAARPLSLTELNKLISDLNYPSLERRLGAMRLAGQIEARPGKSRRTPYAVTDWLRRAVAPLTAAAQWERRYAPDSSSPIGRLDIEAAFLLTLPLLRLPTEISGDCRFAVEVRNGGGEPGHAGVLVGVDEGRVTSCISRLEGHAVAWASGNAADWMRTVIDHETGRLEVGGDCELATALLAGLHGTLSRVGQSA